MCHILLLLKFPLYLDLQALKLLGLHHYNLQREYLMIPDIILTYPQVLICMQLRVWYPALFHQTCLVWCLHLILPQFHMCSPVLCHIQLLINFPLVHPLRALLPQGFHHQKLQINYLIIPVLLLPYPQFESVCVSGCGKQYFVIIYA